jgi:hypothetical protein
VTRTDSTGRYTFVGLAPGAHEVSAYGTPFMRDALVTQVAPTHVESAAPDLALGGSASADFDVLLAADLDTQELAFELQLGRGKWLKPLDQVAAPTLDDRSRLVLRGLPQTGCTLVVSRWIQHAAPSGAHWTEQVTLARVPFQPQHGAPTSVTLDLRPQ